MNKLKKYLNKSFNDFTSKEFMVVNDVMAFFTILSIVGIVLETVPQLEKFSAIFWTIEIVSVIFFSVEYVGRLVAAPKKLKYILSFFGLIDLLAILPTFLQIGNLTFLKSVRVLRILRFMRMMRLAKMIRYNKKSHHDVEEYRSIYRTNLQIYFTALFSSVLLFGALIYVFGGDHGYFTSIPKGMLWSAKVILGGIPSYHPPSVWGEIISILGRFTGLVLFGLLINVVGVFIKKLLFGSQKITDQEMENNIN